LTKGSIAEDLSVSKGSPFLGNLRLKDEGKIERVDMVRMLPASHDG
jgi:hypothetical protein